MPDHDAALFQPSLTGHRAGTRRPPWRLWSLLRLCFVGALPLTLIAAVNARRLDLSARDRALIVALGIGGLLAELQIAAAFGSVTDGFGFLIRAAVVVAAFGMWLVQRRADRVFAFHNGDEGYASLTKVGWLAAIGLGIPEFAMILAVAGAPA
jgi:hypothetical protein